MKKGPLSNKEKDFIKDNLVKFKDKMNELAAELGRSPSVIEKFVKTLSPAAESKKENATELYAKNEERGVTVMTETASMAADESKQQRKSNQDPDRYTQCIHKIKEQ